MEIKGTHTTDYVTKEEVSTLTIDELVDYINGCKDAIKEARAEAEKFRGLWQYAHNNAETTEKKLNDIRDVMRIMLNH